MSATKRSIIYSLLGLGASWFISCSEDTSLFTVLDPNSTKIDFVNVIEENSEINIHNFMNIYTGGGVGVGDLNNDGLTDIFFAGNVVSDRLYLNKGNLSFEDITEDAGLLSDSWSTGVSMVDINQDGWLDIYVSVSGGGSEEKRANRLYINQKDNTFLEQAGEYGLADTSQSTHAAFFDYDKDGDLDMFLIVNPVDYTMSSVNTIKPRKLNGESNGTDKLYRNNGNGTFTDVSTESGILIEGYSLGIGLGDIDNDGWTDVYISNDFLTNDVFYRNNGDGTFSDVTSQYFRHTSFAGMGNDIADINNDGLVDIMVLDMLPEDNERQKMIIPASSFDKFQLMLKNGYMRQYTRNTLQLNNGNGSFSEIGQFAGVSQTDWSWSVLFADYDNDGHKDAFVTNGFRRDIGDLDYINYQQQLSNPFGTGEARTERRLNAIKALPSAALKNYFYKNNGDHTFSNTTDNWGIKKAGLSNGSAFADLDNDGDLDLVVNNINAKATILRNNTAIDTSNFIKIQLKGNHGNLQGIGTTLTVYANQKTQFYQHYLSRGYESSVDGNIHFGLGSETKLDSLVVEWQNGSRQVLRNVKANQLIAIAQDEAEHTKPPSTGGHFPTVFKETTDTLKLNYVHKENSFVDFKVQPLLPHMHSKNGPKMAVGDINGDQLDDFYIGGSAGNPGSFFVQGKHGDFEENLFDFDREHEDMGALLFDADGDGDNDLYVVSGGSEFQADDIKYQDRLYINDGLGNFTRNQPALPYMNTSGSVVITSDFDEDGDMDLFVGGRLVPGSYPTSPRSYLLENQNGKFVDVTRKLAPELETVGMVSTASWSDYDNNGKVDLVLAGEFMPITLFKNTGNSFENRTSESGLANTSGWWNTIVLSDFDNDGDLDMVGGNLGTNSRYKASAQEPLCIYAKDFDKNSSIDPIMCYYIQGENYIAHPRDLLAEQIAAMKGRFRTYRSYAEVPFKDAFLSKELEGALVVKATEFKSLYIENLGNGTFSHSQLSPLAQLGPINGILPLDVDRDGLLDLLVVGNNYAGDASIGNHDALIGLYLKGKGNGNFDPVPVNYSGFYVNSDAKDIKIVAGPEEDSIRILVSSNTDKLRSFTIIPN